MGDAGGPDRRGMPSVTACATTAASCGKGRRPKGDSLHPHAREPRQCNGCIGVRILWSGLYEARGHEGRVGSSRLGHTGEQKHPYGAGREWHPSFDGFLTFDASRWMKQDRMMGRSYPNPANVDVFDGNARFKIPGPTPAEAAHRWPTSPTRAAPRSARQRVCEPEFGRPDSYHSPPVPPRGNSSSRTGSRRSSSESPAKGFATALSVACRAGRPWSAPPAGAGPASGCVPPGTARGGGGRWSRLRTLGVVGWRLRVNVCGQGIDSGRSRGSETKRRRFG